MDCLEGNDLLTGHPVLIRFDPQLSKPYCEPLGTIFTADNAQQIVFTGYPSPYEAYGYHPERPGATPTPFWGDHYIKPDRSHGKSATPWVSVKATVNREVFLESVMGKSVPGKLYWSRSTKIPKLICPQYHRHLIRSYEAIWAIIEALRKLSNDKNVVPSRLKILDDEISIIYQTARKLSANVNHAIYRSAPFISKLLELEVQGLSPHYQPIREKLKSISAEIFEVMVAEFIRSHWSYEVYWSYDPPFTGGEVDVYARNETRNGVSVLIGSCKFRTSAEPRPISHEEVKNLAQRLGEAGKHERGAAQGRGVVHKNVEVAGALFTNARAVLSDGRELAKERGITILRVDVQGQWYENPTGRRRIKPKDLEILVDGRSPMFKERLGT